MRRIVRAALLLVALGSLGLFSGLGGRLSPPQAWPTAAQVREQVQAWSLTPAQRVWLDIRWTEDPELAFQAARRTGRPVFMFQAWAPLTSL